MIGCFYFTFFDWILIMKILLLIVLEFGEFGGLADLAADSLCFFDGRFIWDFEAILALIVWLGGPIFFCRRFWLFFD